MREERVKLLAEVQGEQKSIRVNFQERVVSSVRVIQNCETMREGGREGEGKNIVIIQKGVQGEQIYKGAKKTTGGMCRGRSCDKKRNKALV